MEYQWNHDIPNEFFYDPQYNAPYAPPLNRHGSALSDSSSRSTDSYYNSCHSARPYHEQLQPTGSHNPQNYHNQHHYSGSCSSSSPPSASRRPVPAIHRAPTFSSSSSRPSSIQHNSRERFYCQESDCHDKYGHRSSFSRRADLNRHYQSVHGSVLHACPWPRCERRGDNGFPRIDHLVEHRRGYHHEKIPKREVSGGSSSSMGMGGMDR